MKLSSWSARGCALAFTAAMGLASTQALAAEKLVYATYFSDIYSAGKTDNWFMSEVEKRSNGEITFEKYWSQSLVRAPEMFPALRRGAVNIAGGAPSSYNVTEYPLPNRLFPLTSPNAAALTSAWTKP